jgi:hypothetical protein
VLPERHAGTTPAEYILRLLNRTSRLLLPAEEGCRAHEGKVRKFTNWAIQRVGSGFVTVVPVITLAACG